MNISGNTVLITGGATGIGFALAEVFLAAGNTVLICGRRENRLKEAQQKHPSLHYMPCDVSEEKDREALLKWATGEFDVNVLVNNAGIQRDIDFTKGMEDLRGPSEIKINLEAPVYLSALFIPHLMTKSEAAILNFTSGLIYIASPRATVPLYIASKAAIHSFTFFLRKQLEHTGIKVFEVVPPIVDTEINMEGRALRKMPPQIIKPEEFSPIVMKGLSEDRFVIFSDPSHYPQPLTGFNKE